MKYKINKLNNKTIMKKLFAVLALCAGIFSVAKAQQKTAIEESKLSDNWYVSFNLGGQTPLTGNMIKDARFNWGVEAGRYLTPVFGLGAEYRMAVNTTPSANAIDQTNLSGLMKFNLTNLFLGYQYEPRFLEIVANFGLGWGHSYVCGWQYVYTSEPKPFDSEKHLYEIHTVYDNHGWDQNYLTSKIGLDFNFNLGKDKAWQINIKPALVYNMKENYGEKLFYDETCEHAYQLNAHHGYLEIAAGATYKFGNSNGTHNFVRSLLRDQNEIDALNGQIADLTAQLNDKKAQLDAANNRISQDAQKIKELEDALANAKPCDPTCETIVNFACASSKIASTQQTNVERVAQFLMANEGAKVSIKGYTSPEGGANYNQRLSERRAQAVKDMLIKKYGIDESRITAEGCGVGTIFEKPANNRVAINIAK